jgi:hypothetical protein
MLRKITLPLIVVVLLLIQTVTFAPTVKADGTIPGCYIDAPASADEGTSFDVTVKCHSLTADVFGFEFGSTFSSSTTPSSVVPTVPTTYTAGDFVTGHSVLVGANSLSGLYAVSRQGTDTQTGDFTLGSYTVTVPFGLTADGTATVTMGSFKLSDNSGLPITGQLQASPDSSTTLTNLQIAMLDGTITVQSDGAMTNIESVALDLGSPTVGSSPATVTTAAGSSTTFPIANLQYAVAADNLAVTVSMTSHLTCTRDFSLVDGANDASVTPGTITLLAGDAITVSDNAINIQDATAIGSAFGTSTSARTDVNRNGTVDIFDLVHVGRNYGTAAGTCS